MSDRDLTTAVKSELTKDLVRLALFVELMFDAGPERLWSGYGTITLGGNVYTGVGNLGGIDKVEEVSDDVKAAGVAMTITGMPLSIIYTVMTEQFQGRAATIWLAVFDANWALIADEIKLFSGRMDYPVIEKGGKTCAITVYAESRLIDLERPRVRRYTDEDQKEFYPGDRGLEFVTAIQNKQIIWRPLQ